jgi:hypothetical protein
MLPGDEGLTAIVYNNVMLLIAPHPGPAKPRDAHRSKSDATTEAR